MGKILIILAHPAFQHSRVNRAMIEQVKDMPEVVIHDLYECYPNFYIDVEKEQKALLEASTIVWQHPLQWYSCPSLLKEWIDLVLAMGWAYGEKGTALQGKQLLHAVSVGGTLDSYGENSYNRFTLEQFLIPFLQTAHLCGMRYLPTLSLHNALRCSEAAITAHANIYADLLTRYSKE